MPAFDTRLAQLSVLLLEDEPLILLDCHAILQGIGVREICGASTVGEAETLLSARSFDVAILDISLNGASSLPLAARLDEAGIPCGFMTGYSEADFPEGMKGRPYIAKPFSPEQIKSLLRTLVGTSLETAANS